jgi:hypothetical protein
MVPTGGIIVVYDTTLTSVKSVIDDYVSSLRSIRYDDIGDFVLELPTKYSNPSYGITRGGFVKFEDSSRVFMIEDIEETEGSQPDVIVVTGRSAEKLLDARVITQAYEFLDTPPRTIFDDLIDTNLINPTDTARKMPSMQIQHDQTTLNALAGMVVNEVFEDGSVYEVLKQCFSPLSIGFAVSFDFQRTPKLITKIIYGRDRTSKQEILPSVIFSTDFDNVATGKFVYKSSSSSNTAYVITDDEQPAFQRMFFSSSETPASGYGRIEKSLPSLDITRDREGYTTNGSSYDNNRRTLIDSESDDESGCAIVWTVKQKDTPVGFHMGRLSVKNVTTGVEMSFNSESILPLIPQWRFMEFDTLTLDTEQHTRAGSRKLLFKRCNDLSIDCSHLLHLPDGWMTLLPGENDIMSTGVLSEEYNPSEIVDTKIYRPVVQKTNAQLSHPSMSTGNSISHEGNTETGVVIEWLLKYQIGDIGPILIKNFRTGIEMSFHSHAMLQSVPSNIFKAADKITLDTRLGRRKLTFSRCPYDTVIDFSHLLIYTGWFTLLPGDNDTLFAIGGHLGTPNDIIEAEVSSWVPGDQQLSIGVPQLTDEEIANIMRFRAYEFLMENAPSGIFEATLPDGNNGYGRDFYIGDIVEIRIFGVSLSARIVEQTKSTNSSGIKEFLSFRFTEDF